MKPWDDIVLTEEEKEAAIEEWKKRKWFHERSREYWEKQDKPKVRMAARANKVAVVAAAGLGLLFGLQL